MLPPSTWDSWRRYAPCLGADPRWWFPNDEFPRSTVDPGAAVREWRQTVRRSFESAAMSLCVGCPVREECARWAVEGRAWRGIFGGLAVGRRAHLARMWKGLGTTSWTTGMADLAAAEFAAADAEHAERLPFATHPHELGPCPST